MDKLMVVDGNSILNRAFYGLQGSGLLSTSDGLPTNAIYGFINILNKYIEEENPQLLCIAFDLKAPTFRHLEFADYKATRKGMPDELAVQLPVLKEVLDAMNITRIEIEGYEADDIIGTMSKCAEQKDMETIILSGDRDSLQLASQLTRIKLPVTRNRKTETEEYDEKGVMEKYGVTPLQYIDVKGLMGDTSDNIPGVPGVGEKTALKLIKQFGSIEDIYNDLEAVEQKGVRQKLADNKELAFGSRYLATIDRDVPMPCSLEDCRRKEFDRPRLYELFHKLEFKSLIDRMGLETSESQTDSVNQSNIHPKEVIILKDIDGVLELKEKIIEQGSVEIYYVMEKIDEFQNSMDAAAFLLSDGTVYIVWFTDELSNESFLTKFDEVFSDQEIKKSGHDMKALITYLKWNGIEFKGLEFDTMLAAYIIDPSSSDYSIPTLANKYLNQTITNICDKTGKGKKYIPCRDLDREEMNSAISQQCMAAKYLSETFNKMINENNQHILYYEIELPLVYILADMEYRGFKVNEEELTKLSESLNLQINSLTEGIYAEAGEEFNINSPKQLGNILFNKLGLPALKKTKTGYSTNAEVLEQLTPMHEIVEKILDYRQLVKLKTTYAEGLLKVVNPNTGRIHSTFNQMITATGRISSTEPNLQNIPIRLEMGREIRKAFIPKNDDYVLTSADYSQIELRVMAHISGDVNMIAAFSQNEDIHTSTASAVFGLPSEEVTPLLRSRAKAVNFGIIYGIGEFSLAKDLGITRNEAKEYINGYLEKYSGVKRYMHDIIQDGKEKGYVTTLFNRRRYLPELKSSNRNVRAFGERIAMNMPIQGSAADIIKIAMVKIYNKLLDKNMKSKLILQVHDELILEVSKDEQEMAEKILKESMEEATQLDVPLLVDVKSGSSWYLTK